MNFNGYMTSGDIWETEVCLGNSCKFMAIYAANNVTTDYLMYDLDAAYGILGMGPLSPIWSSYVDPETN